MKKMLYGIKSKLLTMFGDIKIFKYPFWIVYDPEQYDLKGSDLRRVLDALCIGDIVCRGYSCYADSLLIPGKYSHSGIYVGNNKVIHAVAEGVSECDILDFLMCDRAIVIRPSSIDKDDRIACAIERAHDKLGTPYDFSFAPDKDHLYCHELTSYCYQEYNIEKHIATALGGLLKMKEPVYLAASLIENPNFETIIEVDGKDKSK